MLAKSRMIKAIGLVNMPRNSTTTKIGFTKPGAGGLKICFQKWPFVLKMITKNEITPNTTVKAMLPVTLAEPGIKPNKLLIRIKKKTVSR